MCGEWVKLIEIVCLLHIEQDLAHIMEGDLINKQGYIICKAEFQDLTALCNREFFLMKRKKVLRMRFYIRI